MKKSFAAGLFLLLLQGMVHSQSPITRTSGSSFGSSPSSASPSASLHTPHSPSENTLSSLKQAFIHPPDSARPGVYWYFMDGNLSRQGMTRDLEAMKKAGIGNVLFLEVNVGIPRGKVDFLSPEWLSLFTHAVREAERLGITVTLGIGPGWSGSGGPWVPASQSMQDLVASTTEITGGGPVRISLPRAGPRAPFFGYGVFTPGLKKKWEEYYEDVAVLAFPTPEIKTTLEDIDELAIYYRAPYSSQPGVRPWLPTRFPRSTFNDSLLKASHSNINNPIGSGNANSNPAGSSPATNTAANSNLAGSGSTNNSLNDSLLNLREAIDKNQLIDLTKNLGPDGSLQWNAPPGKWTIMRFGKRNNGAITRPAPVPGLGFECDKFDTTAFAAHLAFFTGKILQYIGEPDPASKGGLKFLHMDSWEMGAQNWTGHFREEFIKRRGYDPLPFYPVYLGNIVSSPEISRRFLWDLRQTSNELIVEYHAQYLKSYAHRHHLKLSIEPYDMNPSADMDLGAVADVPSCEFWSRGDGFSTSFSCIQAASIGHVNGNPTIGAEAFTAQGSEGWKQHPGSMKDEGDWAFATGVNKFIFHTFAHQPFADSLRPGMTMGGIGVHWDRGQTWWSLAYGYHEYITRCSYLLRQGRTIADILYLTPEGAPQVFRAPASAFTGDLFMADRRAYNFDGCSPGQLYSATVENHQILFPGGARYRILVLPIFPTMTPALLEKLRSLIRDGAWVVGAPPLGSPSLTGYPGCDEKVRSMAAEIWGTSAGQETGSSVTPATSPTVMTIRNYGQGQLFFGGELNKTKADPGEWNKKDAELYPSYEAVAGILKQNNIPGDFIADTAIRYTHRLTEAGDVYFVANRTAATVSVNAIFRTDLGAPELWDPQTARTRKLPEYTASNGQTTVPMTFDAYQSFFIVFPKPFAASAHNTPIKKVPAPGNPTADPLTPGAKNFPTLIRLAVLDKPWSVSFDPAWGGPAKITFDRLVDWTSRPEEGIRYYSGKAVYTQQFDLPKAVQKQRICLDLGEVRNMAHVILNGKDLGVIWTSPWRVDITGAVKSKSNLLQIEVINLWPNRLIGDERLPDDGIKDGEWPDWLLQGKPRPSKRYTFTTAHHYGPNAPLLKSGLIGPVTICGM